MTKRRMPKSTTSVGRRSSSRSTTSRRQPRPRPGRASTAKGTRRLRSSQFAYPRTREYPIDTAKRARAALSYAGRSTTSGTRATVLRQIQRSRNAAVRAVGRRAAKR